MNPLLLPVALIVYAELSPCKVTRNSSRVLLYMYLMSLLTTMYVPDYTAAVLAAMCLTLIGCVYGAVNSLTIIGRWLFITVCVIVVYVHTAIVCASLEYDITLYGYSLLSNSDLMYRETTLLAIALTSEKSTSSLQEIFSAKENKVSLIVITLWWLF